MKHKLFSTLLLGATVPVASTSAAEFIPVGDLPGGSTFSMATDLSADGSTVLGFSDSETGAHLFRWNLETGFSVVPSFDPGPAAFPNFWATSISGDGSALAGYAFTGLYTEGMKWTEADGFTSIGVIPTTTPSSIAVDISADGNAIAGYGSSQETIFTSALLWTSTSGLFSLGFLPEDQPDLLSVSSSFSMAISSDGQVVVGSSASTRHENRADQAFRWTQAGGMQPLGFLAGENQSSATAVSADGSTIAGYSGMSAFRWTTETGMQPIGSFVPTAVSADGDVVVGIGEVDYQPVAMIWTAATAAQPLQTYLQEKFGLALPNWAALTEAVAISDDGRVIAGNGINAQGLPEAFIATLDNDAQTAGSVSYSGSVSLFLQDPDARKFGTSPEDGAFYSEIPDMTLTEDGLVKSAEWADFVEGTHLVTLTGTAAGAYQFDFNFLHADNDTSGKTFTGQLLKGGVHIYSALVSSETAADAVYSLVYADSDGDKIVDGSDAVPFSIVGGTLKVGSIDTGLPNAVRADGSTLNDLIAAAAAKAVSHGDFVNAVGTLAKCWTNEGLLPSDAKSILQKAAAQSSYSYASAQSAAKTSK